MAFPILRLIAGPLTLLAGAAPQAAAAVEPARIERAVAAAEAEMRRQGMPGLALIVLDGDRPLISRGFGREAWDRDDPVTPDTIFMYNSISKQLVAAAVLRLAQRGRLSVEDPVARHLPDWRHLPSGLRLRHLLTHSSGMRDQHVQPGLAALFDRPGTTWPEFALAMRDTPSDFAPGERWSYANINYLMLQLVVERATGRPLAEALQQLLFRPLGLTSVRACEAQPGLRPGEARGHVVAGGGLAGHPPEPVQLFAGAGGFCGSAADLARWTRALATGRVVGPDSWRLMTSPAQLAGGGQADYGFGLVLVRPDGARRIGHGGYGGGFGAQAAFYPDSRLTIVVMGNGFLFPERIERRVVRDLLDLRPPPYAEIPTTAEARRSFTGAFDVGVHGWHPRIEERGEQLWFVLPGPPIAFPLIRIGEDVLAGADDMDGYRLVFSADRRELELLGMGLMTWYGRRLETAAPVNRASR